MLWRRKKGTREKSFIVKAKLRLLHPATRYCAFSWTYKKYVRKKIRHFLLLTQQTQQHTRHTLTHCSYILALLNGFPHSAKWEVSLTYFSSDLITRTEPQCITCGGDVLWSSRYYYENCTHFGAYVAPQSSIASDAGVEFYILECRGPGLPLAGEYALEVLKSSALATGKLPRVKNTFHFDFFSFLGARCGCLGLRTRNPASLSSCFPFFFPLSSNRCTFSKKLTDSLKCSTTRESNLPTSSTKSLCRSRNPSIFSWHMAPVPPCRSNTHPAGVKNCAMPPTQSLSKCKWRIVWNN